MSTSQSKDKSPKFAHVEKSDIFTASENKVGLPVSDVERNIKKSSSQEMSRTRAKPRRPDMQLYVPRARRTQCSVETYSSDLCSSDRMVNKSRKLLENRFDKSQSNLSNMLPKRKHETSFQDNCDKEKSLIQVVEKQNDPSFCIRINKKKEDDIVFHKNCDNKTFVKIPDNSEILNDILSNESLIRESLMQNEMEKQIILDEQSNTYQENILHDNTSVLNCDVIQINSIVHGVPDTSPEFHKLENNIKDTVENCSLYTSTNSQDIHLNKTILQNCAESISSNECADTQESNLCLEISQHNDPNNLKMSNINDLSSTSTVENSVFTNENNPITSICDEKYQSNKDTNIEVSVEQEISEVTASLDSPSQASSEVSEGNKEEIVKQIPIEEVSVNKPVDVASSKSENPDDSWDSLFDDSGECLNPDLLKELTSAIGDVKITTAKYNYYDFQPHEPDVSGEEYGHIVEFYDFPVDFKNQDLMTIVCTFKNDGFNIKWVDDTHALGVFSSPIAAMDALNLKHPLLKVRPLSQGIRESKLKAKRCAEFLQPYRPRPVTSATLARRLVSGALGVRVQIPKEQREIERQKLKEARDRRRQTAKQKQDVWNGVI